MYVAANAVDLTDMLCMCALCCAVQRHVMMSCADATTSGAPRQVKYDKGKILCELPAFEGPVTFGSYL